MKVERFPSSSGQGALLVMHEDADELERRRSIRTQRLAAISADAASLSDGQLPDVC